MRLTTLFIVLTLGSRWAQATTQPLDQARWKLSASTELCKLTQSISGEGQISFVAEPGQPVVLQLETPELAPVLSQVTLHPIFESWQPQNQPSNIPAQITAARLKPHSAWFNQAVPELLHHIRQGGHLSLQQQTHQGEHRLTFASIRGGEASDKFHHCISQMLPLSWQQAREQSIPFDYGNSNVSTHHLIQLQKLARYIQLSPHIKKVLVDGHTDAMGTNLANRLLSQQRADDVAAHLIEMGVPKSLLEIRAHGNRNPIAFSPPKKSAHNRRVTIRLIQTTSQG